MREEDVEKLIVSWDERLGRIDENLIALEGEPAYQMLTGGGRAGLRGTTRDRVSPALDTLGELFEHRERLNALLARAKELREGLGFWNKDERVAEIAALLGGPSIVLGTKLLPVNQRNLLDAAASEVTVTPEVLLGEMVRAYQIARDAVAEVGSAWARLEPLMADLERDVAAARAEALALGQTEVTKSELDALAAELDRVRAQVSGDPLGVSGSLDVHLAPRIRELRAQLAELALHKANVARGLGDIEATLGRIDAAFQGAEEASARASREVAAFDGDEAKRNARRQDAQGLLPWREKIASTAQAGRWKAADVGLARWFEVANGIIAAEHDVVRAATSAENARSELEGRLSARRAQLGALAARGALASPALEPLDALARDAQAALRARPTDLLIAKRLVDRYEASVVDLAARARR